MNNNNAIIQDPPTTNSSLYEGVHGVDMLPTIIEECLKHEEVITTNKKIKYYNVPVAFDIETTSFTENGEKRATMYEWTLGINNAVVIGRTWKEFQSAIALITEALQLDKHRRLICYVHNLAFEFQWIRRLFTWEKVFAISDRKPIYALSSYGIEFRCSYILSGYNLAMLGDQLHKYPVQKMVGDLDYSLPRHSLTPLTDQEIKYCENDVRVVMSYIQECIERDGDITKIPLTKTGYVRNFCRNACLYEKGGHRNNPYKYLKYRKLMSQLTLTPDEYKQLKRAFQGGFTHANAFHSGEMLDNVGSFDFTSSYPAVMVSEQFPMSQGEVIKIRSRDDLEKNLKLYCCLFDVEFIGLEAITLFEHPISKSRCWDIAGVTEDNGRIVEADRLKITITEQDYYIIKKFYKWQQMKIGTFRRYRRGYLPTDFVKAILKLYADKTTLKGVAGREEDYLRSKEMLNSCYGMCVTDICRDEITYNGIEWGRTAVNIDEAIEKDNKSVRRFLFFAWGVWVTAYARKNLFTGIYEFKNDYVYSDTDSIKGMNIDKHQEYINRYDNIIVTKLEKALNFHHIPLEAIRPKTIKGEEKVLGVWDYEGIYTHFKTVGAKRYLIEKPDALIVDQGKPTEQHFDISLTVSGVAKTKAIPFLFNKYGIAGTFEHFDDDLYIPPEYTGKLTHTYIDDEMHGVLIDYTGTPAQYDELSGVHLEPAEYSLSLADVYVNYLEGIKEIK